MCRFALYLGSPILVSALLTEPTHSVIKQSFRSREGAEPLNGDGFGIAWYAPDISDEPAVFKDLTPAWNNVNLANLARVTRTPCLFAHVRAATPGLPVTQLNCHPFAWGPLAFMHNGHVAGFARIKRVLQASLSEDAWGWIKGSTDSEHVFALLIDAYREREDLAPLPRLVEATRRSIEQVDRLVADAGIDKPSPLNLAVSDGRNAVVSRYASDPAATNSLYVHAGGRYECVNGECRMVPGLAHEQSVIVASEPLSEGAGWRRVEPNHLVAVDANLHVTIEALHVTIDAV